MRRPGVIAGARSALAALTVVAFFAGCRTLPPRIVIQGPGADAPWPVQEAALARVASYNLAGRVAVAANGQGFTANLRYSQAPRRTDLALDGPMGIGGLRVSLEGDTVSIATSRGEQLDGAAAREELERRLGFVLPLAQLRWWLLGVPSPEGAADLDRDATSSEIRDFTQAGWKVIIQSRAPGMGFSLPRKLTAEREGARLKLIVEHW